MKAQPVNDDKGAMRAARMYSRDLKSRDSVTGYYEETALAAN